ncbi:carboxypeptidase-like regulatory domain-containing protein [Nocardia sp. NBC_01377]|uniref:carboxypeptidase-like regulatory domain-containing protein n=1 Tax=Nocardia sp. NBC_01377 TaxID=2903595 RepID=UPI0032535138
MTPALIRGVVDSPVGPVAFASVYLESAPAPVPDVAAMTGEDGGFVLAGVGPGRYRIGVNAPGYDPRHVEFVLGVDDRFLRVRVE